MSKQEDIERVMRDLERNVDAVDRVVVATSDGLAVATTVPGERSDRVAAMAASVVGLSQQAAGGGADAPSAQTVIRGTGGCLVVQAAGPGAVLAVRTEADANMGLIQLEVPRAASEIGALLG